MAIQTDASGIPEVGVCEALCETEVVPPLDCLQVQQAAPLQPHLLLLRQPQHGLRVEHVQSLMFFKSGRYQIQ